MSPLWQLLQRLAEATKALCAHRLPPHQSPQSKGGLSRVSELVCLLSRSGTYSNVSAEVSQLFLKHVRASGVAGVGHSRKQVAPRESEPFVR